MRAPAIGFLVGSTLLCLAAACGKSTDETGAAGGAGTLSAGSGIGGSAAGNSTAVAGSTSTGGTSGGSSAGSAGGNSALLECDPSKVLCKRTAPQCVFGEVPEVVAGCYGECVKVDRCACSTAAECPQPDQYTCWSKSHCGPFVH
jgi:hypothetical protein